MKNDYRRLVIALLCNGDNVAEENLGCRNKRCKYRDVDGACDIVGMCNDAAKAISDLLARAEKAESNLDAAQRLLAEKSGVNGTEKVETCFGYTLDKVRELVEADKDGRCWTLPVKQTNEVWFEDIDGSIISETGDYAGPVIHTWSATFKMDDIDKTVFLTRKAAESALAKEADHERTKTADAGRTAGNGR